MTSLDYPRWIGLAICAGGAIHSARMVFDPHYCLRIIRRIYKPSDQQTEGTRLVTARIAAAVGLVAFANYGLTLFVLNP